jgi:hypothetical protein
LPPFFNTQNVTQTERAESTVPLCGRAVSKCSIAASSVLDAHDDAGSELDLVPELNSLVAEKKVEFESSDKQLRELSAMHACSKAKILRREAA